MSDMLESQGTKLEMSSGTGSPVTTMTATVGNPTVLTKSNHGLKNGTVGTLSAFTGTDSGLMNDKVVIVKYATTNTFAVDIDTTEKTLEASNGTFTPKSYTEIGNILDWDNPSDTKNMIEYTTLGSIRQEEKPGIPRNVDVTFNINWTTGNTGLLAAETARAANEIKTFKLTYSDNKVHTFDGYVTSISNSGAMDDKISGSITIRRTGSLALS